MNLKEIIEMTLPNSQNTDHFKLNANEYAKLLDFNYKNIINKIKKKYNKTISKEQILRFLSFYKNKIKGKTKKQIEKQIMDNFK